MGLELHMVGGAEARPAEALTHRLVFVAGSAEAATLDAEFAATPVSFIGDQVLVPPLPVPCSRPCNASQCLLRGA